MKKLFLLLALCVATVAANAYTYSVALTDAHWDFEDEVNVRPTASSAAFYVPDTWKTGTSIAAYMPQVCPNGNEADKPDKGYNSRHCLYLNNPSTASRVPVYAMMPQVSDKQYNTLKLEFMARTFNSSLDTQTSNTVYGDWKLGYLTDLADTVKANFSANVHYLQALDLTANWTKYSIALDSVPTGAYMVVYATDANHIRYMYMDNVAFVVKSESTEEPEPEQPSVAAGTIVYHLTGCTADATNPATYTDEDESGVTLTFTAEEGYTLTGWEVEVKHGQTVIPNNDWASAIGYVYPDPDYGVFIYYTDDITDSIHVTVTCPLAKADTTGFPETFSPATFEDLTIATNDVYRPATFAAGDNKWFSGAVQFRTDVQDYGSWGKYYFGSQAVSYSEGFTPTDYSDAYLPGAKGAAEGNNYGVINPSGAFEQIHFTRTTLTGMAVTNTAFNVNAILNGDGMSVETAGNGLPFHEGDYFLLTIKGLDSTAVTGTVNFYLADFRDAANMVYAENWQWIDLSSLGEIDGLQFELSSTKTNSWGMTTAAYFCVDNIGGQSSECTLGAMTQAGAATAISNQQSAISNQKIIRDGQLLIEREGHLYNAAGQLIK